ncbi:polyprenyl diphosphate synthase [Oscillospiraceae bacterium MB08-C2-2]|nr:polyprenyl diphosphate synthase [Oscillospiraceae bacterium MB08-C2-2]
MNTSPRQPVKIPRHLGLIMDGNGRWAKKRGLPVKLGHKKGSDTLKVIVNRCRELGIEYLTVYAFSTENWKRPKDEVESLMALLEDFLLNWRKLYKEDKRPDKIRTILLGDPAPLSIRLQALTREIESETADNTGLTLNIAFNYGGRDEILRAAKLLIKDCGEGLLSPLSVNEEELSRRLYTKGQPDVDLIIRPSGEQRLSNFMIWQSAYAEFVFMDVLWPDFSPAHLDTALEEFASRDRRFGGR